MRLLGKAWSGEDYGRLPGEMEINSGHSTHGVASILHIPLSMDLETVRSLQSYLTCLAEPSLHQCLSQKEAQSWFNGVQTE